MKVVYVILILLCQLNSLILSLQARDIVSYSCPSGWKLYENTCIRKYNNFKSYDDAIDKCHTYSAQLVSIKTVGKENAVTSILRWWSDYWIGLFNPNNDNNRDHYQWIADNTQLLNLSYSNWYATEPNHEGPCIVLSNKNGRWKWYDRRCNGAYRYICQKDAVATTTQIYISSTFLTSSAQSSSDLVEINPTTSSKFTDYPIGTSSIELSSDHRTMAITSTFNSYTIISTGNEEQAITKLITTESYIPVGTKVQTESTILFSNGLASSNNALTLGPNLDISITATPALSASTTSEVITSDTEAVFLSMIQSSDKMTTNSLISNSMIGSNHEMSSGNNLHYSISTVPSNQLQVLTEKPVTMTALNQDQVSSMVNSVEALSSLNLFISSADMDRSVTMQINLEEHSSINQFSPILITALSSLTIPTNFIINPSKEMTSSSTIISMCPSVTPFENISIQCIPTTTAPSTRITLSQTVATTPTIIPQGTVRISIASSPETEVATGKITTTTTIVTTPIPSSKNFISTSDSINRTTSTASFKQPLITTEQPTQIPSTQTVKVTQKTPRGTLATRPEIKATPRQPSNTPSLKPESPTSSTFKATSSMPKATTPPQYTTVNIIQTEISTTAFTSTTEVINKTELSAKFQFIYSDIVDAGKVQSVDNASGILTKLQSAFQTDNNVNSGDLIATKNALSALSKSVNLNNASSDEKTIYFQKYFTVIGSLTSKDKASVWKSANKNFSPTSVILKLTDDMAKKVANNLLEGQIFTTKTPEMTIQVEKVSSNQFRRSGYKIASQGYQFSLPATAIGNNNNANAPVITISEFSALQYITNEEKTPTTSQGAIDSDDYINSMVIGCSMDPPAQLNHSQPFTYTLPYQQTNYSSNYKPSCVFWDFQNGNWSDFGCVVGNSNKTHVQCKCSHLTHFAMLMRVSTVKISDEHTKTLTLLTQICCGSSMVALLMSIVFLSLTKLNSERLHIHFNLVVAIVSSQCIILLSDLFINHEILCKIVAIVLHFLFSAIFSWMLAEGFHLFFQIVTVYTTKPKLRWYYILGWGIPTVIVSVSVGLRLEYYGINKICWLSINSGLIWAFVGPAIAIIAVNFIILLIVIRIAASKAAFQVSARSIGRWKSFKSSAKAIAVLLPILGLTWLFGILSIDANTIFFSYLFVIFNGLQGVSFFIMHCLLNTEIRSTLLRRANKFRYESSSGPSMLKAVRKKTNVTSFAMADHEIQHARASSISMDNDDDIGLQRLYTGTSILRHPSGTPSCNTVISAFSFPEENETILNQPTD